MWSPPTRALLAHHGAELAAAAAASGVVLAYEAAVAGGIPIIKTIREGLAANRIRRVAGILNGTCNYILTQMHDRGAGFAETLADAQRLGYAEADPGFDIDGIDAAHKLAILAGLAFGHPVALADLHIEGIRAVSALDQAFARELGYRIRLLGIATQTDAGIIARVHPCMIPHAAPLAGVDGVYNAVVVQADFAGRVMLEGRGGRRRSHRQRRGRRPDRHRHRPRRSRPPGRARAHTRARPGHRHPHRRLLPAPDGHRPPPASSPTSPVPARLRRVAGSMLQHGRAPGERCRSCLSRTRRASLRCARRWTGSSGWRVWWSGLR